MNDEQVHQNYLFDNHRRLFHKTKLKAISRTSALLSGFAMIAMVEISFDDYKDAVTPMPLIVIYISLTCLVVGVHLFALMLSSCILPLFEIHHLFTCRERDIIYVYAEFAWILSTCVGIVLFVVQMVVVCWIKFLFLTRQAAIVTTNISFLFFHGNVNTMTAEKGEAIKDKALKQNGEKAIYYVNRALCYIKLKQWDKVYQDARHCLDLDPNYIKAHAYLGQYYIEQQRYDEAITCFKQALDLCKTQNKSFGDEIQRLLRYAQKRRFSLMEQKRIENEISLQTYLRSLIQSDKERRMQTRIEKHYEDKDLSQSSINSSTVLKYYQSRMTNNPNQQTTTNLASMVSVSPKLTSVHDADSSVTVDPQLEQALRDIEQSTDQSLNEMNNLFNEVDIRRKRREIPEYLTCKLCYDLMRDPVITPFGITYCRSCIEENLYKVSHLDPIANKPLVVDQLVNNLVLKEIVEKFIKENEWVNSECF
ncbi:unnamed protein product [Adineta ricciae]|uniref:RING-type E3 ubiquitin transferase n=1 Tax=Adineta ricciae TaxID=249248 RepID=A0A813RTT9_ADIRI|nr:unnamed protein product [Adineta ricciae]